MYGRAMSCDVCNKVSMLALGDDVYLVDSAPPGWIRLILNQPKVYSWETDKPHSPTEAQLDCCSLSCARSAISAAQDAAPTEVSA